MGKFLGLFGLWLVLVGCADLGSGPAVRTREVTRVVTVEVTREVTVVVRQGLSCTLMDCGYGLTVALEGDLPPDFSINVVYDYYGESLLVSRQCHGGRWVDSEESCRFIRIEESPAEVTVTARWAGESTSRTYQPIYEEYRPNGPNCEPVCPISTISFPFP